MIASALCFFRRCDITRNTFVAGAPRCVLNWKIIGRIVCDGNLGEMLLLLLVVGRWTCDKHEGLV